MSRSFSRLGTRFGRVGAIQCAENANHPRARELFDRHRLPSFHDPFAGGGALPLEAQRLGLEPHGSDLNPVAVLINKAMIEIPPKLAGNPPVNPDAQQQKAQMDKSWRGAQGLADDLRYYGQWMRDEEEKRIGHLYPKVEVTAEMARERLDLKKYVGQRLTVIAWLWARTVKSPNPAFAHVDVPLASTLHAVHQSWQGSLCPARGALSRRDSRFAALCRRFYNIGLTNDVELFAFEDQSPGVAVYEYAKFPYVDNQISVSSDREQSEMRAIHWGLTGTGSNFIAL